MSAPSSHSAEHDAAAFIRALLNAWDCCATCAGGVLARRDRERDARRDAATRAIPPTVGDAISERDA